MSQMDHLIQHQANGENEVVTPNYAVGADDVVEAAKQEFRRESPAPLVDETDRKVQEDILLAAHEAIDHVAGGSAAVEATTLPTADEEERELETNGLVETAAPAEPSQSQYPPMIGKAYEGKQKANLSPEEEMVWWRLYMGSTNRVDPNNRAPRNVWTAQERDLVDSVSDAGLKEMQGRLLTLLSGVEYSLWERSHRGPVNAVHNDNNNTKNNNNTSNNTTAANGQRRTVTSSPAANRRRASSLASQATTTATATTATTATALLSRRRVLNAEGEIVRSDAYTPRASSGNATPVKGTRVDGARHHTIDETSQTLADWQAKTVANPSSPYNLYSHPPPQQQQHPPQHPQHQRTAVARGGASRVVRGSGLESVAPSSSSRWRPSQSVQERPPFDLSFNSSVHSSSNSHHRSSHPPHRTQSPLRSTLPDRTPRGIRLTRDHTEEPLRTVPGEVHAKRQSTVNPTKRRKYKSVYAK